MARCGSSSTYFLCNVRSSSVQKLNLVRVVRFEFGPILISTTCIVDTRMNEEVTHASLVIHSHITTARNGKKYHGKPREYMTITHTLLKKGGLDTSHMKNYRSVSNLSFLSQSLDRVVQRRLQEFLDSNNLMPETQSAYRQYHSTETAVTRFVTTYSWLLIRVMSLLCVYLIWQLPLTP